VLAVANNVTLRLAVANSLDSVFVWSIPLGGQRAYSDGGCPAALDATLTGADGSQFGAALALSSGGKALVIGVPGAAGSPDAAVLVADVGPPKAASPAASAPPPAGYAGLLYSPKASAATATDNTYFVTNPSSVLVSARRGSVGVPAPQAFSLSSWASGSPGGAPYSAAAGYSIAPVDPYTSGGTSVQSTLVSMTSVLKNLGLGTAAVRAAVSGLRTAAATAAVGARTGSGGGGGAVGLPQLGLSSTPGYYTAAGGARLVGRRR
jgi:hypothetical protein